MNEPLITADNETPLIKYVPLPELHLLIGVTTHIYSNFQKEYGQLADDWMANLNLQMSHRGQFNGNSARILLKKVDKLNALDPGKIIFEKFAYYLKVFA